MAGAAVLAIEDCGQRGSADWSDSLLVLDSHLRLMRRIGLGSCTEVGQLSADAPGTSVLLYGYNFCASVPAGPASRLWLYTSAGGLRLITATKADHGISGLTW
jgi:hypothetical protein